MTMERNDQETNAGLTVCFVAGFAFLKGFLPFEGTKRIRNVIAMT